MPPKKLLLPLPAGSSHLTFKFYYTWCIQILICCKPACQKHNPFFINLHGIWEKTHLLWPGWWDMASTLSYEWKVTVLVSHWLPNCTRKVIGGECAFTSALQEHIDNVDMTGTERSYITSAASGHLTSASVALTNYGRRLLCLCGLQLLTMLIVALNWQIMLLLIICLSVSPFCSNYSSSARMTKYQHKVHSHCWLSSPKKS